MRAQLGKVDVGSLITLELANGMTVTISNGGHVQVSPGNGSPMFGYFFDLPALETVTDACNAKYTEDEQERSHGELTGMVTVYHRH